MENTRLDREHYDDLLIAERMLHDQLKETDKLTECDIECQDLKDTIQAYLKRITGLKKNFAPQS